jgi:hypothetical protein
MTATEVDLSITRINVKRPLRKLHDLLYMYFQLRCCHTEHHYILIMSISKEV